MPVLEAASLAGAVFGSTLLVRTAAARIEPIVGLLLLLLLPVLFLKPEFGVEARADKRKKRAIEVRVRSAVPPP